MSVMAGAAVGVGAALGGAAGAESCCWAVPIPQADRVSAHPRISSVVAGVRTELLDFTSRTARRHPGYREKG